MRVIVATFACMKFEMYETLWNTGGPTNEDFVKDYVPNILPENSRKEYKTHHETWKTILDSSVHPGAIRFKKYLTTKFGKNKNGKIELNTEVISRNIAFAVVLMNNSKHNGEALEVGISIFKSAQDVRDALVLTECLLDSDILDVIEMFEEITRGKVVASE